MGFRSVGMFALATTILGLFGATSAHAEPTSYALSGGRLEVIIKYDRSALIAGHDHVLVSTQYTGDVTWDPDNPGACKVSITMPAQSLNVDPPGARARHGFEGETGDGDKKSIKKNALSKGQLNANAHPNITYSASSCSQLGNTFMVNGQMTIRGKTVPVKTKMAITADGSAFSAKGKFSSTHEAFGFSPYTALLGSLRNDNALTFHIDVKGSAK